MQQHYLDEGVFIRSMATRGSHGGLSHTAKGVMKGKLVRKWEVSSKAEGCVVDDQHQRIFVAEEEVGLWVTRGLAAGAVVGA